MRKGTKKDYEGFVRANLDFVYMSNDGNEMRCVCSFHEDTDPSFSINRWTGQWMCHSSDCGLSGGISTLRMLLRSNSKRASTSVLDQCRKFGTAATA